MFVELHPEAETELIENANYYEYEVEGLGYRFIEDVERGIELLISQPLIGQPFNEQLRSFVLGGFPFSLIYSFEQDKIWIVAIAHQKRRPDYWRKRISR
jgi:plasmid stabilization system protein ParE